MEITRLRRRVIAASAVICAGAALAGSLALRWESLHTVAVETAPVEYRDITGHVICQGELEYGRSYGLYAAKTLQLDQWHIEPGTTVSAGQTLVSARDDAPLRLQDGLRSLLDAEGILAVFSSLTGQESPQTVDRRQLTMLEGEGSCALLSPVDGIVTQVTGLEMAPAEFTLLVVADPGSIRLSAQLPEEYVQDIAVGMPCQITGSAFRERSYEGTITDIAPFAYTQFSLTGDGQRVVDLTIAIDDADGYLSAGYSAEAKIENYIVENALFIPFDAVLQDENNVEYVYVIDRGRAFRRDIVTGQEFDGIVEVLQGLALDELVITDPQPGFYDGMPVRQGGQDAGK